MEAQYQPQNIEETTQTLWRTQATYKAKEDPSKQKFYCLSMFPYPSGYLHMGHVRNYTIGDVIARQQRMLGKSVLHPMGWDAFGLPAENAAIKNKIPPAKWTYQNIDYMRGQFQRLGFSFDWSRELTTCRPEYYRWEQWFFLQLFKKGLVYKKSAEVNWDPVDQTILANEQVVDGRGWRSGALVERREIPQWFLKISAYADELLNDLDTLPHWPEQVKTMQRNWIGRSEGIEIQFALDNQNDTLTIYTTRPDTLFGVSYIALAPQHPIAKARAETHPELQAFIDACKNVKVSEADFATLEKKGVNTGLYAIHPFTKARIPIWVANFVLMEYGSGAVMAVPAHDARDFEFAQKYHLPLPIVIQAPSAFDYSKAAYLDEGKLIDSGEFTGLASDKAKKAIMDALESQLRGQRKVHFRLRDWSISRQRYWGTPVPIIHCKNCGAVAADTLPVVLPEDVDFTGVTSPLKTLSSFLQVTCPQCGKPAERETDTFDTFFESSWYYARFACPDLTTGMLDERATYWTPVDQYIGGIEHAVMHLLYARFMHKLLRDEGLVNSNEPFTRLLTQGMVLNGGVKMSKSVGNTVDPQPLIERYGADTVRLFVMFASPPEQSLEWSDSGVEGAHRFLKRLWTLLFDESASIRAQNQAPATLAPTWDNVDTAQKAILRQLYEILEQALYDYDRQQFNTVVSGCMKLLNLLSKIPAASTGNDARAMIMHEGARILLCLLAPIAPHITHQLWQDLGFQGLILDAAWPKLPEKAVKADSIQLVVQTNGKLRSHIHVPHDASQETIQTLVLADAKVQQALEGKHVKKVIIVPGRLVNVVIGETP